MFIVCQTTIELPFVEKKRIFASLNISKEMKKLKKTPRYVTEEIHAERTKSPVPIGRSEVTDADIEYVHRILPGSIRPSGRSPHGSSRRRQDF